MFFDKQKILDATDGGLEIILQMYPDAYKCVKNPRYKFKAHDEKTPSAQLKEVNGLWYVNDFGDDGKPHNAIDQYMKHHKLDFKEAVERIAKDFGIPAEDGTIIKKEPKIRYEDASPEQKDGSWDFHVRETGPTDKEIENLFETEIRRAYSKERLIDTMEKLNCVVLDGYSVVKNRKVTHITATEDYPLFMFEHSKEFRKIYRPAEHEKGLRFLYHGEKPANVLYGLSAVMEAYDELEDESYDEDDGKKKKNKKPPQLPEIIICSGETDSLNVAACGYHVVWRNSESELLLWKNYIELKKMAEKVMYLGDIDATGIEQTHKLALNYLDIHCIRLPLELLQKRDRRGYPRKDVRDFFKYHKPYDFGQLVKVARPYRFWDETPVFNKAGEYTHTSYKVNNIRMYNFLSQCGFYRLPTESVKEGYKLIFINGNVVGEKRSNHVKDFIHEFLEKQAVNDDLRNAFYRSTQLSDNSLSNLPVKELEFKSYEPDAQFLFFKDITWRVTAKGIDELKPKRVHRFVWEEKVLPHKVSVLDDMFKIWFDKQEDRYKIKIINDDSILFKFIERTTRIHWRVVEKGILDIHPDTKEQYVRTTYTEEEKIEQELHLINRIFTLGYMLHCYKEKSKAWVPWALEHKITDADDSRGGSGKSIFMDIPTYFMKTYTQPSRVPNFTDNKHWNENIDESTDYVHFEDFARYGKFDELYPLITSGWTINPKNTKSFPLSYQQSPKMGVSSNYPPRDANQSTERRLIYTVFSDYYHSGPNEEFDEDRSPKTEFGINLFDDFDEDEWNRTINFVAQCLKFYLSCDEKINPPMDNVTKRNLKNIMGDAFHAWADTYFAPEAGKRNTDIIRREIQKEFNDYNNFKWSPQQFKRALQAWCRYNGLDFNPPELCNDGRIIKKINGQTEEVFYVMDIDAPDVEEEDPFK